MTNDPTQYPVYNDSTRPPHPHTEAKLLRDLVSHQKGQIDSRQLKRYCQYLGLNENFFDPTDTKQIKIFKSKLNFICEEARKVIKALITKRLAL